MKKRILLVLLAVVCILSFAACKKDTPQSLFENAEKTLSEIKGYEAKMTMITKTEIAGSKNTNEIEMNMKVNGDNLEISVEDQTVLYVDGFMYMDMGEMGKFKVEMSLEDMQENLGVQTNAADLPKLDEEDFKDVELVEDGDNRSFTVVLDEETVKDYLGSALDQYMDEDTDVAFSNMALTATFDKDDTLVKVAIKFDMTADMGEFGGEMTIGMETVIEFVNIKTAPTISAPADADKYEEMDADDMF